jgi:hypothetical protein
MEAAGLVVAGDKAAPLTVNAELLRATGLIGSLRQPVKILGNGEVNRPLFIVADAFTRSAREKVEAAGGTAQLIEVPSRPMPAIGLDVVEAEAVAEAVEAAEVEAMAESDVVAPKAEAAQAVEAEAAEVAEEAGADAVAEPPRKPARKRTKTETAE